MASNSDLRAELKNLLREIFGQYFLARVGITVLPLNLCRHAAPARGIIIH